MAGNKKGNLIRSRIMVARFGVCWNPLGSKGSKDRDKTEKNMLSGSMKVREA
ncbi:MAG: hypothetical protein ACLPN1_12990 [Dissulfurispiraceae bacterium]|jgi:hypothetical protein